MTQTFYAHMNKIKIKKKDLIIFMWGLIFYLGVKSPFLEVKLVLSLILLAYLYSHMNTFLVRPIIL
jgi:hypothetical protein